MKTSNKPAPTRFKPGDLCRVQLYRYPSRDNVPIWKADGTFSSVPSGALVLLLGLLPGPLMTLCVDAVRRSVGG